MKGARLFAGIEHDTQVRKIARHFKKPAHTYKEVVYDKCLVSDLRASNLKKDTLEENKKRNWGDFKNFESAYHQLMLDLITQQIFSTQLVIHNSPVKKVFVEGGFSKNAIYMNLLAEAFPDLEVYASSTVQASALGAALAIHENWNQKTIPKDLIDLKIYKFN
jgi:glycerol kinase